MVATIVVMILLDAMHPPAVATSLSFALRAGNENNLVLSLRRLVLAHEMVSFFFYSVIIGFVVNSIGNLI